MPKRDTLAAVSALPALRPATIDTQAFSFSVGTDIVAEFVLGHSFADILRELVQNEYDAGGTRMEVAFGADSLRITGNGKPIDDAGWKRLKVVFGTGHVSGSGERIEPKANGIGSKNLGMRSLFLFGDQITIRSGGWFTMLHAIHGAFTQPHPDEPSQGRNGVCIEVECRTNARGKWEPFTVAKEEQALDSFAEDMPNTLLKLARPGTPECLSEVVVTSERVRRRLSWKQTAAHDLSKSGSRPIVRRTIRMSDGHADAPSQRAATLSELEFQQTVLVPADFRSHAFPEYFKVAGGRVRVSVSVALKRDKLDLVAPGRFYYPLGAIRAYTGNAVSVNAPFDMNGDRSQLIDSDWNTWLLEQAVELTLSLLTTDWVHRFGADAYLCLRENPVTATPLFSTPIAERLQTTECWLTRAPRSGTPKQHIFAIPAKIVLPEKPEFDGFLTEDRYLAPTLMHSKALQALARQCGAKPYGLNSLIRLYCAGKDEENLASKLKGGETNWFFTSYPSAWKDAAKQVTFAQALDANARRLTANHKRDIDNSPATLTAAGTQSSVSNLFLVSDEIATARAIAPENRLAPQLTNSKVIPSRCRKFDYAAWMLDVAQRASKGNASEAEREALYDYILASNGRFSRDVWSQMRSARVLKDHAGEWVSPASLILRSAPGSAHLSEALHFPHPDYSSNGSLLRTIRVRKRVDGMVLIDLAFRTQEQPELADRCEEALWRFRKLLTPTVAGKLRKIPFLRSSSQTELQSPETLYVRNAINVACLGESVPFAVGQRSDLHKQLGCLDRPKSADIVAYLDYLRLMGQKPEQPELLYPALVQALHSEKMPTDRYKATAILWNGTGYSSPDDTLLSAHNWSFFLRAIPRVGSVPAMVRAAYKSLGAQDQPQHRHWKAFFAWLDATYGSSASPVPRNERRAVLEVYARCPSGAITDLPDRTRCLLDRKGGLYSREDIRAERYLLDDDPDTRQAIMEQGAGIAIADDGDKRTLRFFASLGIRRLTQARQVGDVQMGAEQDSPLDAQSILRTLHRENVVVALSALLTEQFSATLDYRGQAEVRELLQRLSGIAVVDSITVVYSFNGVKVNVPKQSAIQREGIYVTSVGSDSELEGFVAQALAEHILNEPTAQRNFADVIFRLLRCNTRKEIEAYLKSRGISFKSWQFQEEEAPKDHAGEEDAAEDDSDQARRARELVADTFKNKITNPLPPPPTSPPPKVPPKKEEPPPVKPTLPPLGNVVVNQKPPTAGWSPQPARPRNPAGRSTTWQPPTQQDTERDQAVGKRGEEIVLRHEIERVVKLGFPASRVMWIADTDPGADYDLLSVDDDGTDLYIEVKSTSGRDGRFSWPRAEFERAVSARDRYLLCRVYEANTVHPTIKMFRDPIGLLLDKGIGVDIANLAVEVEPL